MTTRDILAFLLRLPAMGAWGLIRLYQVLLSPMKAGLFGPGAACRFYPTCSDYGIEAIRRHGLILGGWRTCWRILKCHPFHPGGFDPVPSRRTEARTDHRPDGCSEKCSHG